MSAGRVEVDGLAEELVEELVVGSVGVEFMRHTVLQGFELHRKTNILLPLRKPNMRGADGGCWRCTAGDLGRSRRWQ